MSIIVNSSDPHKTFNFKITFDEYGNLYFDGSEYVTDNYFMSKKSLLFQVNISGKNIPLLEPGCYDIIETSQRKVHKMFLIKKDNSLKAHIKNKKEEMIEQDSDSDEFDEEINEEINYYPEEDDYFNEQVNEDSDSSLDEDNLKQYGKDNQKFIFSSVDVNYPISVHNRQYGDISALYDTYIYEKDVMCYKSNSQNNNSIYRFRIYENGKIYFRLIGYPEICYVLYIDQDGSLLFVK
jgi:hypothetical protein